MVGIFSPLSLYIRSHVSTSFSCATSFRFYSFYHHRDFTSTACSQTDTKCDSPCFWHELVSVFSMGLSCGDSDFGKSESGRFPVAEDCRETGQRCGDMEAGGHSIELDVEFWPVEHPLEPQEEDRPVKCPIPTSSLINDGRVCEESFRKRAEVPEGVNKEGNVNVMEPRVGAVRKRHHTLSHGDVRSSRMSALPPPLPLPPLQTQNVTIFQMLQQYDKFDY